MAFNTHRMYAPSEIHNKRHRLSLQRCRCKVPALDKILPGQVLWPFPQARCAKGNCSHSAGQSHFFNTFYPGGWNEIIRKNIHHSRLKAGAHILHAVLFTFLLHGVNVIQYSCFKAAKAEIQTLVAKMHPRKVNCLAVSKLCGFINYRTSGISQPDSSGNFVKCLSGSIIPGFPIISNLS